MFGQSPGLLLSSRFKLQFKMCLWAQLGLRIARCFTQILHTCVNSASQPQSQGLPHNAMTEIHFALSAALQQQLPGRALLQRVT